MNGKYCAHPFREGVPFAALIMMYNDCPPSDFKDVVHKNDIGDTYSLTIPTTDNDRAAHLKEVLQQHLDERTCEVCHDSIVDTELKRLVAIDEVARFVGSRKR